MSAELITVNGIEMEYFSFGSGKRPFVILPGVSTRSVLVSAMALSSAYHMFAQTHTVYVFDRRKNMPPVYPVRQMASDTAQVMRALGLHDADVFGASQGGMMALCMAIDSPELVHRMVIGSSAAAIGSSTNGTEQWISLAKSGDMTALTAVMIDCLYASDTVLKHRDLLIHMNDGLSENDIRRFIIQTEAIDGFDVYDELDKITCPVLVIGSQGDKVLSPELSRKMADKLHCELYMYGAEYGHCVFDEAPDYKQRMLDFFTKE